MFSLHSLSNDLRLHHRLDVPRLGESLWKGSFEVLIGPLKLAQLNISFFQTGNCWLYDMDKFRVYLHVSSLIFIFIGISLELGMVYFADRIKYLFDDEEDEEEDNDGGGVKREKFELKDAENGRDLNANVTAVTNGNMDKEEEEEEEDLRLQQPKNGNIENFGLVANLGSSNTVDASVNK